MQGHSLGAIQSDVKGALSTLLLTDVCSCRKIILHRNATGHCIILLAPGTAFWHMTEVAMNQDKSKGDDVNPCTCIELFMH